MKRRCWVPVLAVVVALAAAPARTEDAGLDPARNEASVFGGISIIDARRSQRTTIPLPAIPGFPGWPGRDPGGIQVGTETKLGNSGLVGLRYAFYLRKQLALEADVAVAPSHDLRSSVDLCGSSGCYGRGDDGEAVPGMHAGEGRREGRYGFGGRNVTAWHYGAGLTYDGAPETRTDFVLRFGAGLKVYFGRLGARVDAVDHLVFDNFLTGRDEHDVHLTGGAFVRF